MCLCSLLFDEKLTLQRRQVDAGGEGGAAAAGDVIADNVAAGGVGGERGF